MVKEIDKKKGGETSFNFHPIRIEEEKRKM